MNLRALIVDDELDIQSLFEKVLVREGFTVDCASDRLNAEAYLAAIPYDIIFVDLHLDTEMGTELLEQIFTSDQHAQVVLMTGKPSIDSSIEATRFGVIDYLTKPFDIMQIVVTAQRAVRNKRLLEENARYRRDLVDKENKLLQFNKMASQFCGYCQKDINTPLIEIAHICEGGCRRIIKEVLVDGTQHHLSRIECKKPGGTKRIVSLTVSPVHDEKGGLTGAVSVIRDESAVAFLEKQLYQQNGFGGIIGKNAAMQRLYTLIEALADVQTTVLINGESGVGKELVALALHHQGVRKSKEYIKVNCSALSENLLESELFGHVRGAFTGAISNKIGRFQKADGGTIFLDEIGDCRRMNSNGSVIRPLSRLMCAYSPQQIRIWRKKSALELFGTIFIIGSMWYVLLSRRFESDVMIFPF
jgi:two-component system, NtrC family, response regulator HydG